MVAERIRTARVPHRCDHWIGSDCTRRIEPGERYREFKTTPDDEFWPGAWHTWRSCIRCLPELGGVPA
jgi:hypothetical protein